MEHSLRDLRKEKVFSLNELGSMLGMRGDCVSHIERGKRELKFTDAKILSKIYGISLEEIYTAYENTKREKL